MHIDELKKIISQGESANLEFKTSTSSLKNAFETICAFLNARGGIVLIGVKNDGQIIGQHVTDQTRLEIANFVAKIEPPMHIEVNYISVSPDKFVILIQADPKSALVPYVFEAKPFCRIESATKIMSQ